MNHDPRFPIGKFTYSGMATDEERQRRIGDIGALPGLLRAAVQDLSSAQLETPYREGGWTVRQVVHHVPESHMNAYIRFKLALTENTPTVKPYDEARWATTGEVQTTPVEVSLTLLDALHYRWVQLLRSMQSGDFDRKLNHPEMGVLTLDQVLALYSWHGRHHTAHVNSLRDRMGWNSGRAAVPR